MITASPLLEQAMPDLVKRIGEAFINAGASRVHVRIADEVNGYEVIYIAGDGDVYYKIIGTEEL